MQAEGDTGPCGKGGNLRIALDRIGRVVPVGMDFSDFNSLGTQGCDGCIEAVQGACVHRHQVTTLLRVGFGQSFDVVVDEAHSAIEGGQPVEDVAVEAEEPYDGVTRLTRRSESAVVIDAQVAAVPEDGNGRHGRRVEKRQPGSYPGPPANQT